MNEKNYIRYRKLKAFGNSLCFYLCRIFPIRKNLISVCTFEGKGGFGCNPKYVVEELHRRNPNYRFVWFVNDMQKPFPDYVKKVPNTLWSRAYWLSVSKIWIDNYRKPLGTRKRKGQYYLNTNHYTIGFKNVGLWRGNAFSKMAYLVSKSDSDMTDDVVIDSKWCEEVLPKGLVYEGSFLKTGAPRCDVLFGDRGERKKHFREMYNLPVDAKLVMFAPTFREGAKDGKRFVFSETWSLDFERLLNSLEKRFGGKWYLCLRLHPQLAAQMQNHGKNDSVIQKLKNRIVDVSWQPDMHENLAAMDAYITDYSSAAMDAVLTGMPVFLYADDLKQYVADRGGLMWHIPIESGKPIVSDDTIATGIHAVLPFVASQDNDELEKEILQFDETEYEKRIAAYKDAVGIVFDGRASEKIAMDIMLKTNTK